MCVGVGVGVWTGAGLTERTYIMTAQVLNRLVGMRGTVDKITCHKCGKEIRLLQRVRSLKGGRHKLKLYHNRCYLKTFYD